MAEFAAHEPRSPDSRRSTPAGLVVRVARVEDAPALGSISARREGKEPAEQTRAFEAQIAAMWSPSSPEAPPRGLVLTAEIGGEAVGFGRAFYFRHPPSAPLNAAPEGWYLGGVVVDPAHRRSGIGHTLTVERLRWIADRAPTAYYFASTLNVVTIDLHRSFGFVEVTRDFWFPAVSFRGGVGILFRVELEPRALHNAHTA